MICNMDLLGWKMLWWLCFCDECTKGEMGWKIIYFWDDGF